MASLYDLLCYHSLTSMDPLLEELLTYFPTRFHSNIFDYISYEPSSDEESVNSIDSSVSAFNSDDSTYFSLILFSHATPRFYHKNGTRHTKGLPAESDRRPKGGLEALHDPEAARVGECPHLLPPFLGSPGGKQSEPLPTVETG